jgi:DNA replication and repair protein RecF
LPLSRVRITALRCLAEVERGLHPRCSYIFGPNGAGKTSILEGIFLLGRGRSFRTRQIRRLVRRGADGVTVYGEVIWRGRAQRLGVSYVSGRLEKKIDGAEADGMGALAALLPVHVIDPSVHQLVEGGPSERRRFLDWGVFHVEHGYLEAWKRYRRVLSQRNAALKAGAGPGELRSWTTALAEAGTAIDASRRAYVARLAVAAAGFGRRLLEQRVELEYRQGWRAGQSFVEALAAAEPRDRLMGTTEVGPHRADLVLHLEERRVQDEASRGQQKLTATALVLAQVAVGAAADSNRDVLLIDDPAAELDAGSLERLLGVLRDLPAQLVLTGLSPRQLVPQDGFPVFHVERGEVDAL